MNGPPRANPLRSEQETSQGGCPPRHVARHEDYNIAWICALHLELTASRAMLDEEHASLPIDTGDHNAYVLGRIDQHNIVMACLPGQYGTNNAAIVATNLNRSFPSIRATLMVGIGGGSPSQADLYLGDVVVGTRVMQYDMGKVIGDGRFQGTADAKAPAPLLNAAVSSLRSRNPRAAVASFFFNARGDFLEKSITGMYRSLLMQLFKSFSDLQIGLDDTDIVPWNQQGCPDLNALKELLRSAVMALGQRSFACFIDALDECDEQEVRDMVQFFEDMTEVTTDHGIQFRICFSSRPYPYIDIRQGNLLTLEDESGHADDLAQYVKNHLRITNPSLLADLQAQILDKAAGIFMWVVLVVGILNKESDGGALAIRTKLSEIPPKLSDLFRSMLTRDQDRPEWLLLCVLWILCAKRPLNPAEFRHALWAGLLAQDGQVDPELPDVTDMDECVRLVTSSSKGLAEITKSWQPTVQFIHESITPFSRFSTTPMLRRL
ncbi:Nucleoside phosphorylase domain protein [Cordyceps fumosorosea ARSEF 2679]|uniref:Nucleoside phosphorylase domain protein n=1 Tax=Cordyceps fumosorosea (strain ARSEF 2679) TaxID=1081104 RepID=A0A167F3C6_CORFA|nr:Nucleoside phosphorylase domain protein [Cordyceps fumosorosea ARSEF 2679]OAA44736.1 Nucleoside phosphorylase domain protein [Cordyceps fumosorosea ARSEF 2679]